MGWLGYVHFTVDTDKPLVIFHELEMHFEVLELDSSLVIDYSETSVYGNYSEWKHGSDDAAGVFKEFANKHGVTFQIDHVNGDYPGDGETFHVGPNEIALECNRQWEIVREAMSYLFDHYEQARDSLALQKWPTLESVRNTMREEMFSA